MRVTGMVPNHGFSELERLRHRSPSPMASANSLSNVAGTGLSSWNGLPQEVVKYPTQQNSLSFFLIYNIQSGRVVML